MHLFLKRRARLLAVLCAAHLGTASSAQAAGTHFVGAAVNSQSVKAAAGGANGLARLMFPLTAVSDRSGSELATSGTSFLLAGLSGGGALLVLLQAAGSPNQCMSYSYDLNGNVTARTNGTYGATATWGSASYGCFNWTVAP